MKNFIIGLLVCLCTAAIPNVSQACGHAIKSVTLMPTTACLGEEVQVTVRVELHGRFWSPEKWYSTSIDGICHDHDDYVSNNNQAQQFTETFIIFAPGAQGVGNVQIKTFAGNGCTHHRKTKNVDLTVIWCCPECEDGDDCTIEQGDGFVIITCGNTVAYLYDGEDGMDGQDGTDGQDGVDGEQGPQGIPGLSCIVEQNGPCAHIYCEDGTSAVVCNGVQGEQGEPGEPGVDGEDGEDGVDGESCYVTQEGDCAVIYCGNETIATVCDGVDGVDGVDGTSCWVEQHSHRVIIHCGNSQASVWNGLNCWDLNENHCRDFCSPCLRDMFNDECPIVFFLEYQCEVLGTSTTKARQFARTFDGHICETEVNCVEFVMNKFGTDDITAAQICNFTEDTNGDGSIDIFDCRGMDGADGDSGSQGFSGSSGCDGEDGVDGQDGSMGPQGLPGEDGLPGIDGLNGEAGLPGIDGIDGINGEGCEVIDNLDGTCMIVCVDSDVLVYDCGVEAESEPEPVPDVGPCGAFGGFTIIAMLMGFGFVRFRHGI